MKNSIDLSIIIPVYNEEDVLPLTIKEIVGICKNKAKNYEIIFIDDGSIDSTFEIIQKASRKNSRVKIIRLSRNFGHQAAFNAGIDFAQGKMIMTMDGDLQHPPALIPEFIKQAKNGYDIVIGERIKNKQNSRIREATGRFAYKLLSAVTSLEFRNASDFNLYNRSVVSALKKLPEKERFLRGMIQWVGFRKKYLPYEVEERKAGVSKYGFRKLLNLGLSGITSFSAFPLRVSFWMGLFVFITSMGVGIYVIIDYIVNYDPLAAGFATLALIVLFLGSIQLMVLGVVGEYLYKMFNEVKGRPLYIVSDTYNIDGENIDETQYGIHKI
jgi:polyisoprenyl-phosphate glycosyltransferase